MPLGRTAGLGGGLGPMRSAILKTTRLILEPMAEKHFEGLAALRADPAVMAAMQFGPETRAQTQATFAAYRASWRDEGFGAWAILDAATGSFLGETGLRRRAADNSVALRVALAQHAQGRGLAGEAVAAVLAFAFGPLGLARVTAVSRRDNPASVRLLLRAGFSTQGDDREDDDKTAALERFAIAAADWRERHRENE